MSTVSLNAVGPIEHIEFDMPEGKGGVKLLVGTSGVGKTTALRMLQALIGETDAAKGITPLEGEDRGEVSGLGRTVKVGKIVKAAGETEVPTLRGRLDISTLVDPKVADPAARQKARIRCLVSLSGSKATAKDLLGLAYSVYKSVIDLDSVGDEDDPVALADKLKRSIDAYACEKEREADRNLGVAQAKRIEAGEVESLRDETESPEKAAEEYRAKLLAAGKAKEQKGRRESVIEQNRIGTQRIETYSQDLDSVGGVDSLTKIVLEGEQAVEYLTNRLTAAKQSLTENREKLKAARNIVAHIAEIQSRIKEPESEVTDEEIDRLAREAEIAGERMTSVASIDRRRAAWKESEEYQEKAIDAQEAAMVARNDAKAVANSIQSVLPEGLIRVEDGVLVVDQPKRKKPVPFEDLSTGQKWKVAVRYGIKAVGKGGLLVIAQEAWQALGPELRQEIAELCAEEQVWLISGMVGEGELRVEDFQAVA